MSTNPIVDYHLIYALALIALALTYAATPGAWAGSGPSSRSCTATAG